MMMGLSIQYCLLRRQTDVAFNREAHIVDLPQTVVEHQQHVSKILYKSTYVCEILVVVVVVVTVAVVVTVDVT